MKTTIFYASVLFIFISTSIAQAQIEVVGIEDVLLKLRLKDDVEGRTNSTYNNIEGNPFMFNGFTSGNVKLKGNKIYNGMLQFDKYAGEIHFKKDNDTYAIAFPEKIKYIEIDDIRFIYSDFKLSETSPVSKVGGYFVVLLDKKCKLLAKKNISIREPKASNGIVAPKPAKFINSNDSYFLKIDNSPAVRVKSKKDLKLFFNGKGSGISEYIKKGKIKFNNPDDLIKLAEFYNQQLSQ